MEDTRTRPPLHRRRGHRIYEVGTWTLQVVTREPDTGRCAFGPDGAVAALIQSNDGVRLLDPATGRTLADITAPRGGRYDLRFSADGRTLIVAGTGQVLHVWDLLWG